jgi:hypothetical protein
MAPPRKIVLPNSIRNQIAGALKVGMQQWEVVEKFKVPPWTVSRINSRLKLTGNVDLLPRPEGVLWG